MWLHPHHPDIKQLTLLQIQEGHGPTPYISILVKLKKQPEHMLDGNLQDRKSVV